MRIPHALLFCLLPALTTACSGNSARGDVPEEDELAPPGAKPATHLREIEPLIERGRRLLDAGRPRDAEVLFEQAAKLDGGSLQTRMWVLRAWMDEGRSNDTLDALDALDRSGAKGPEMSYLYGMTFARRAEGYVASGVTDSSVEMNFTDAKEYLKTAVNADAVRYRDAYLPLARSAWFTQDLETARWAADRAVEVQADGAESWLARGRIAMAQFIVVQPDPAESAQADTYLADATTSFQRALALFGTPSTDAGAQTLAQTATELAHALIWKKNFAAATEACATAIAWAPDSFDYAQTQGLFTDAPAQSDDGTPIGFRATLEAGRTRYEARAVPTNPRAGVLYLWLGWTRFVDANWAGAEEAFLACVELAPEYTNGWFYIGLSRLYSKDHEGALAALRKGWDADPATMVTTIQGANGSLRAFDSLTAWCAAEVPPRNLDAALLSEMLAQAFPQSPQHWNNLGLFLRDEGERLEFKAHKEKTPAPDPAVLTDLYGRSFRAYQRALELSPDDPQVINDTVLMLQYHLEGDAKEIEAMYRRSIALSEQRLAAADLSAEDRTRFEQTKKDAAENLQHLLEPDAPEKDAAKEGAKEAAAETTSDPTGPHKP